MWNFACTTAYVVVTVVVNLRGGDMHIGRLCTSNNFVSTRLVVMEKPAGVSLYIAEVQRCRRMNNCVKQRVVLRAGAHDFR